MSAIKTSQIHDGFATIRSRGLQRSRSRVEQLERLKPMSMKCDSMPLYENAATTTNNNNLNAKNKNGMTNGPSSASSPDHQIMYKFEHFSGIPEMPLMSSSLQSEAQLLKSVDDFQLNPVKPISCGTFKNATSQSQLSTSDRSSSIDANDRSSLPPPSPCYETYSNGFHSPTKTPPESMRSSTLADYFLYVRPTSPIYESYASVGSRTSSSPDGSHPPSDIMYSSSPPSSKIFQTSYYSKSDALDGYALQKIQKKSFPLNYKAQSLQYRKSYSHPTRTTYIHETSATTATINKFDRGIRNYYNSTTNYYDPNEINYMGLYGTTTTTMPKTTARSSELLNGCDDIERTIPIVKRNESFNARQSNTFIQRPYATLAHPRDAQQRLQNRQLQSEQQRKYASNELTSVQNDFDYLDPLDCKVGCQTTLRSKPQIPWYELAIKKDSRRQSCPAIQVN